MVILPDQTWDVFTGICPIVSPLWSGKNSSNSDDDVPLSKLQARPRSEEKRSRENRHRSNSNSEKDKSGEDNKYNRLSTILPVEVKYFQLDILWTLKAKGAKFCTFISSPVVASDDSSDDEPLIKMKTVSTPAKKPVKKDNRSSRSNGTNNKKAGGYIAICHPPYFSCVFWFLSGMDAFIFCVTVSDVNTDASSDNEPLIKIAKVSPKAAKKPKKSVDTKKKGEIIFSPWTCSIYRKLLFSITLILDFLFLHRFTGWRWKLEWGAFEWTCQETSHPTSEKGSCQRSNPSYEIQKERSKEKG